MESGLAGVFGPCRGSEGEARLGPRGRVGKAHGVPASETAGGPPRPEACAPPLAALAAYAPRPGGSGMGRPRAGKRKPLARSPLPREAATAPRAPGRPAVSPAPTRARRLTGRARPAPPVRAAGAAGWGEEARRETPGLSSRFALPPRPAPRPDLAPLLLRREQITSQEIAERSGESKARQICLHPENRLSV